MNFKKILATLLAVVMVLGTTGVSFANDEILFEIEEVEAEEMVELFGEVTEAVAQIDSNFYASLADAVEAVKNGETINLLASLDENVVDINKTNVAFTIDGALADGSKAEFTGTIQMNIGQNVTIKNIDFVNKSGTSKDFIKNAGSPTGKNYNTTLTVENCSFTGDKSVDTVALRMTHPTLVTVKNCEGTALHSFIQNSGGQNVIFDTVKITDSESGFSVGGVRASTVKNCELSLGEGFGIRYDLATANAVHVVENNKIEAFIPVVARRARAENTSVTFNGTNTFTETNTDGLWMAIGDDEKEYNGDNVTVDNITAPTKCVNVVLNDTGLDYSGIIGAAEAKIGNVLYQTLEAAIAALEEGDTLEIATGEYKGFDLLVDNVTITGMTDDTVITIKSIPYNAFIGVNADGAVVKNLNFVIAEDCERTGDYLDGYDSVIGFWSKNFALGSDVPTGCDILNCTFVNKHAGINNDIFNFNSFNIIGNTFENFDAGVQVMNDLASMGTVNINDNTFTKVNTPINVYWGKVGEDDNTLTIADNTFVSAKNTDKIHIGIADLATANGTPGIDGVVISGNTFNAETEVDVVNTSTEISLAVKSALEDVENVTVNAKYAGVVAKIDDAYYQTLDAAITAAKTGETIDLLGNTITIKDLPSDPVNGRRWFDTDGKTLTIQNGTLDLTGANVTDAVFRLEKAGTHLVFDNVDIVKGSEGSVNYFVNLQNTDSSVKFNECDFNVVAGCHSVIANTSGGVVEVVDCDIKVEGKNFIYRGGALVKDSTFTSKTGNIINHNEFPSVIDNTKAETYRLGIIESTGTIDIINGSYVYAVEVAHYYDSTNSKYSTGLITVDETSTLEALDMDVDLINPDSEGTITSEANRIYVQFRKTDVGEKDIEGKDVYEIVLAGKGTKGAEKINELASADLTFFFKGEALEDAEMSYFVTPAEGVSLSQTGKKGEEHRYMFNYDGVTKYEETDTEIVIGEITIEGYGSYTLKTEEFTAAGAKNTNAVYATEIKNSIVDGYTPAADLVVNGEVADDDDMVGKVEGATIAVPVRTLTINVTFPNSVKNNVAAYQNMTVKIAGGNVDKTIDLGTDYVDADTVYTATLNQKGTADAAAYEIKVDLPFNTAYMVTVEGDGYRTARYTVKLTEAKTLNFWNNVMDGDNMIEVEEDAEATATTKTFLAGDIVKDNQINVYDLSAVVSYFGKRVTVEEAPNYAKYDLDRNGVIDARDVAYVLVSWGE